MEDRRVLATLTVTLDTDSSVLVNDGEITLREAIRYVNGEQVLSADQAAFDFNNLGTNDKIIFDDTVFGKGPNQADTILLTAGELHIERSVIIDATDIGTSLIIDAGGGTDGVVGTGNGHGVIHIATPTSPSPGGNDSYNYELAGLTITRGDTAAIGNDGFERGGGITFRNGAMIGSYDQANLTLREMTVTNNHSNGGGGGVSVIFRDFGFTSSDPGEVIIEHSEISRNTSNQDGGGLFAESDLLDIRISDSTIAENHAQGTRGNGGGLAFINADLPDGGDPLKIDVIRSTIRDNTAVGDDGPLVLSSGGGGIFVDVDGNNMDSEGVLFNLIDSTVSGNTTEHEGGGVWFCAKFGGTFNAIQSTISGNEALVRGGGLWVSRSEFGTPREVITNLSHMTITENISADGGGLYSGNVFGNADPLVITTLNHIILSGNHDLIGNNNNLAGGIEDVSSYNLLGPVGVLASSLNMNGGTGNIANANNDPGLLPLAFAGGLTPTHTPNPLSSPAIDAGNLAIVSPPLFDQRGTGYDRIVDGDNVPGARIDIGAVESNLGTSAAGAPQVKNVIISGFGSTHNEYDFDQVITDERTKTTPRTGIQLQTVPVGGADTVSIQFSEGVTVTAEDLLLVGMRTGNIPTLAAGGFKYDASTHTATWRFQNCDLETSDMYVISLADGIDPSFATNPPTGVHDSAGNALDGEWTNPTTFTTTNLVDVSTFPSGDGAAGGSFKFVFTLFGGDANQNGVIDEGDAITQAINMYYSQTFQGLSFTFTGADFDGDGDVDEDDEQLVLEAVWGDINLQTLLITADLTGNDGLNYYDAIYLELVGEYLLGEHESALGSELFTSLDDDVFIGQDDVDHFFAILDSQYGLMFAG